MHKNCKLYKIYSNIYLKELFLDKIQNISKQIVFKKTSNKGIFLMVNYIACDFFTTRLPILSLNNYFEVFNKSTKIEIKNKLFTLFEEELLKELLAIASLDSYQAINRLASSDSYKENKQILSTLLKYYT